MQPLWYYIYIYIIMLSVVGPVSSWTLLWNLCEHKALCTHFHMMSHTVLYWHAALVTRAPCAFEGKSRWISYWFSIMTQHHLCLLFVPLLNNRGEFTVTLVVLSYLISEWVCARAHMFPACRFKWVFICQFQAHSLKETACAGVLSLHIRLCLCFIHCEPGMYFFTAESFPASSQLDLSRQTAG